MRVFRLSIFTLFVSLREPLLNCVNLISYFRIFWMFIIQEIMMKFLELLWSLKANCFVYKHLSMYLVINEFNRFHTPHLPMAYCNVIYPFMCLRLKFCISHFPNFIILDIITLIFTKSYY
jgi:hypothetical protein